MSAHPKSTSAADGPYDSLFDDDEAALSSICFDLDTQLVANYERWCNATSWCGYSSFCCFLSRSPAVLETDGNSNACGIPDDASFQLRPGGGTHQALLPTGSFEQSKPAGNAICACNHSMASSSYCGPCCRRFQTPFRSISIPTSCFHMGSNNSDQKGAAKAVRDYLSSSFLSDDALCHIVKFLGLASLVRLRECSRKLCEVASSNGAGWKDHCNSLWSSKAYVCSAAREMLAKASKADNEDASKCAAMEAYIISVTDAATRQELSVDELCFDASPHQAGIIWSFRFRENEQDARKLVFLRDGTIKQVHPRGPEGAATELNGIALYDVFSEKTVRGGGADVPVPGIGMTWRFVSRPLDLPARPWGAYVRVAVGGRDLPTYVARRSLSGNWGFVLEGWDWGFSLESCWGVYTSFEMVPRMQAAPFAPRWGRGRLRRRRSEGSRWVKVENGDGDGGDDDGELERERRRSVRRRINVMT